ncbi:MAG TPA: hypothetical protein VJ000_01305 [Thermodesulfovibrionia bacterium]|nr:hypothetical protein [Thermodesulfovibrionia bacterium]
MKKRHKCIYCNKKKNLDHLRTADGQIISICGMCLKTKALPQSEANKIFQEYNKARKKMKNANENV